MDRPDFALPAETVRWRAWGGPLNADPLCGSDERSHMADIVATKASEGRHRVFLGVHFDVLTTGERSILTVMRYRADNHVPFHKHPNEQCGYVLSGRLRVLTRASSVELGPGDSYVIPADVEHSIEILEAGDEVQVFTPPREDYR